MTGGSSRDDSYAEIATLASTVSAAIAAVYWIARVGFENPILPVAKTLALSLLLVMAPPRLQTLFRLNARDCLWSRSYSLLWLGMRGGTL